MNYPINLESLGVDSSANELLFKKPCIVPYTSEQIQNLCTTVSPVDPVIPVESYFIHVDGTRYPFGIRNTPIDNFCSTDANILINNTFYPRSEIQEIVFGDDYKTVTVIPDNFLVGCSSLTDINLSGFSNVIAIGRVFMNMPRSLRYIDLSPFSNVMTIGEYFLYGCYSLHEIDLSPFTNVTAIERYFITDNALTSINLSGLINVDRIEDYFLAYSEFDTIDLSPLFNVTHIGGYFLFRCPYLRTLDMSPLTLLQTIGQSFLYFCANLSTLNLSGLINLREVGQYFLESCQGFSSIQIGGVDWSTIITHGHNMYNCPNTDRQIVYADTQLLGDNYKLTTIYISQWRVIIN